MTVLNEKLAKIPELKNTCSVCICMSFVTALLYLIYSHPEKVTDVPKTTKCCIQIGVTWFHAK